MGWFFVVLAALFEVVGVIGLKNTANRKQCSIQSCFSAASVRRLCFCTLRLIICS